jgi:hypothetical protein
MATFQEFAENRRLLQEFCQLHYASVAHFGSGLSFVNVWKEGQRRSKSKNIEHLTSSATCFGSLLECSDSYKLRTPIDLTNLPPRYANGAIKLPQKDWVSDGSAGTYCRCRALPFVIRHLQRWDENVVTHLEAIFKQMLTKADRFAIGEAGRPLKEDDWYPPNGYHTYWTLELLSVLADRFEKKFAPAVKSLHLGTMSDKMRTWARETLGIQVSLHSAGSSMLDSDQLAWSLAIVLRFPEHAQSNLAEQDLIKHAMQCLVGTQTTVGTWRHYAPLFHYRDSGNAYCYVFESFAEVLRWALKPSARFIRTVLKTHFTSLVKLWQYARSTQIPLDNSLNPKAVGWSSGHRTGKPEPESWATASVFLYAQYLRRLVGVWAREEALSALPKRPTYPSPKKAAEKLASRTQTWTSESVLKRFLVREFVKHHYPESAEDPIDPDKQPIETENYRAAILYGPPGTGKTTIARALAGMIGWDYVELHASHFVADGLPNVQRKADEIFGQLMELDHAVVLFDEIDELVREREGNEADAFGRFLTTSMLPRLAQLWENRKLMYFVATNHISYFDRAITRSGRFDTLVFVSPPSFSSKKAELLRLLALHGKTVTFKVSKKDIQSAMPHPQSDDQGKNLATKEIADKHILGKFALLRWDELEDLAKSIASDRSPAKTIDSARLIRALRKVRRTEREFFEYDRDKKFEGATSLKYGPRRPKA